LSSGYLDLAHEVDLDRAPVLLEQTYLGPSDAVFGRECSAERRNDVVGDRAYFPAAFSSLLCIFLT
jgi:hypothetical protein